MEPPTNLPRRETTLTRLWRTTDVADCIGSYLPTKSLAVLPTVAQQFERDKWRSLVAALRQQPRRAVAECTGALLSALQMARRDSYHFREDWTDQTQFSENWTMSVYRYPGGEPEGVDYTATVSPGTLVLDRRTPRNSTSVASQFEISRDSDRCCVHRFRVALTYTPTSSVGDSVSVGAGFQFESVKGGGRKGLFLLYVAYVDSSTGSFQLRWRIGNDTYRLKTVPTQHTFLVDATLDWCTATARVTVDGTEIERPFGFRPLPVMSMCCKCGEFPGQHTFGAVDVWYFNAPPPLPSVRFEGEK